MAGQVCCSGERFGVEESAGNAPYNGGGRERGGREGEREGGREGGRERGREGEREGGREGGRERERQRGSHKALCQLQIFI